MEDYFLRIMELVNQMRYQRVVEKNKILPILKNIII